MRLDRFLFPLAFAMALGGCGLSPGESTKTTAKNFLIGYVADGYIANATVFLDANGNGILDNDERAASTDNSGRFSISAASLADLEKMRLIAIVPNTAIDADSGKVQSPFYLTFPKVSMKDDEPFISPFSTLVEFKMRTSGLTLDEAFASVATGLGVPAVTGVKAADALSSDYIKAAGIWGGGMTQVGEKLSRIGRVTVNGLGKALDQARSTMGVSGDDASSPKPEYEVQRFRLVMANVLDNLGAISAAASELPAKPTTAEVGAKGDSLKPRFLGQNLGSQQMVVAQVTQKLDAAATTPALGDSLKDAYAVLGRSGGRLGVARMFTTSGSDGEVLRSSDARTGGAATSFPSSVLSSAATASWLTVNGLFGSPWFDGAKLASEVMTVADGPQFGVRSVAFDIGGKSLDYLLLKNGVTAANGLAVGGVFPPGAMATTISFIARDDVYLLPDDRVRTSSPSIESFLASCPLGGQQFCDPNADTTGPRLRLQFAGDVASVSGTIAFFNSTGVRLGPDGVWKKEAVRGKTLLFLSSIPETYRFGLLGLDPEYDLFVALDADARASYGVMLRKGATLAMDGYVFNKAAVNAMMNVLGQPAIP